MKKKMRKGGLEPPRGVTPPDPKSGASANSATFAAGNILTQAHDPQGGLPAVGVPPCDILQFSVVAGHGAVW